MNKINFIRKTINYEKCYSFDHALYVFFSGQDASVVPETLMESETQPLEGYWNEGTKSLSLSSPIGIDLTGSLLTISSNTRRSDMTIRISQNNVTLFEQTVLSSETGCFTIDLSNFEAGQYFLELTNQWGGYLYGYFYLE
jgi:hypothetical protein